MKINAGLISLVVVFLLLGGCGKFAKVDMKNMPDTLPERPAEFESVTELQGKASRVVTRIRQPIYPAISTKHNILKRIEQYLDKELGKQSGALVDRSLNAAVKDEIELAEIYGKSSSRQDIDYVLLLVLDDYQHDSASVHKEYLFDAGKKYYKCKYSASYSGWIRVYEIPSMKVIDQWEIKRSSSRSHEESNASMCTTKLSNKLEAMHSDMIKDTVCRSGPSIRNAAAPSGHVLAMNKTDSDVTYEISLGGGLKIKESDTIRFYHQLSDESYAEGVVVGGVKNKSATVKLTSIKQGELVYRGDWVRPYYTDVISSLKCMLGLAAL
jgi:hypothetical protein